MMKRSVYPLAALVAALAAGPAPAAAQASGPLKVQAPPVGFAGALVSYTEDSVTLTDRDGKNVVVAMTPGWTVSKPRPMSTDALRIGDFVASANKVVDAQTGHATELRIMEPGYRPEYGTHLMAQGGAAMTHGTVSSVRPTPEGLELVVSYPGGGRRLMLAPDMKITDFEPLGRTVLKPGLHVNAVARKGDDGVLRAGRLTLNP